MKTMLSAIEVKHLVNEKLSYPIWHWTFQFRNDGSLQIYEKDEFASHIFCTGEGHLIDNYDIDEIVDRLERVKFL